MQERCICKNKSLSAGGKRLRLTGKKLGDGAKILFGVLLFLIAAFIAANAKRYSKIAFDGVKLWALSVLPPLFPFFFLSSLITGTGLTEKLANVFSPFTRFFYKTGGVSAYPRIMSLISGYPVGVRVISDLCLSGAITSDEASDYAVICSTSGPNFIIGCVGTCFGGYGLTLFFVHLFSSFLAGVIFGFFVKTKPKSKAVIGKKTNLSLGDSVYSAVVSVLTLGGFVTIFYIFSNILADLKIFYPLVKILTPVLGAAKADGLVTGLIECTFGCKKLAESGADAMSLSLASLVISFGGLSVWAQSKAYLKRANASFFKFAAAKTVQSLVSFLVAFVVFSIIL